MSQSSASYEPTQFGFRKDDYWAKRQMSPDEHRMNENRNRLERFVLNGTSANVDSHAAQLREELLEATSYYSADYFSARERFLAASTRLGLEHHALQIHAPSPNSEPLTIDITVAGAAKPTTAIVLSSGVHGVEGLFGSAVQLAFLEQLAAELATAGRRGRRFDSRDQSVRVRLAATIQRRQRRFESQLSACRRTIQRARRRCRAHFAAR